MNTAAEKVKVTLKKYLKDASHILFPAQCLICEGELPSNNLICSFCEPELLLTHFEKYNEPTALDQLFWGREQISLTYALLFYKEGSSTQQVLHQLKYKNKPETGRLFGEKIAEKWGKKLTTEKVDLLLPVPIHAKKKFLRGYNQSTMIAEGISKRIQVPIANNLAGKIQHTGSQTKRGRFSRWDNVTGNFTISNKIKQYKHIALVDDVITTGSTLEALIKAIRNVHPSVQISIVSLAVTK
jgi:competence protein ComFC